MYHIFFQYDPHHGRGVDLRGPDVARLHRHRPLLRVRVAGRAAGEDITNFMVNPSFDQKHQRESSTKVPKKSHFQ